MRNGMPRARRDQGRTRKTLAMRVKIGRYMIEATRMAAVLVTDNKQL